MEREALGNLIEEFNGKSVKLDRRRRSCSTTSNCSSCSSSSSFSCSRTSRTSFLFTPPTSPSSSQTDLLTSNTIYLSPRVRNLLPIQEESSSSSSTNVKGGLKGTSSSSNSFSKSDVKLFTQYERISNPDHKQLLKLSSCMRASTSSNNDKSSSRQDSVGHISFEMVGGEGLSVYQEVQINTRDVEAGNFMRALKGALLKKVRGSKVKSGVDSDEVGAGSTAIKGTSKEKKKKKKDLVISNPFLIYCNLNTDPQGPLDWNRSHQLSTPYASLNAQQTDSSSSASSSLLDLHQDNIMKPNRLVPSLKFSRSTGFIFNAGGESTSMGLESDAIEHLIITRQPRTTTPLPSILLSRSESSELNTSALRTAQTISSGMVSHLTSQANPANIEELKKADGLDEKQVKALRRRRVWIVSSSWDNEMDLEDDDNDYQVSFYTFQSSLSLSYPTHTISASTSVSNF